MYIDLIRRFIHSQIYIDLIRRFIHGNKYTYIYNEKRNLKLVQTDDFKKNEKLRKIAKYLKRICMMTDDDD